MSQFTPLARLMAYQLRRTCPPGTRIATVRARTKSNSSASSGRSSFTVSPTQSFHSTGRLQRPYKDDQDKDSLKPGASEYSKSGAGDDQAAATDAAFDPNQTKPEEQGKNAEAESGGDKDNALNVSPANTKVSQGKKDDTVEKSGDGDRKRTSGAGSAPKAG